MEMKPPLPDGPRTMGLSGPSLNKLIGIGWTALSGLGLVACTFHLILRLFTHAWDTSSMDLNHMGTELRDTMAWFETHSIQILAAGFFLNASTLGASVSLVWRQPWARTILQFLIAGHLACLVLMTAFQVKFAVSFMKGFEGPMVEPGIVRPAFTVIFVAFTLAISGGFCVMYLLSIAGLRSAKVRAVFEGPPEGGDAGSKSEA